MYLNDNKLENYTVTALKTMQRTIKFAVVAVITFFNMAPQSGVFLLPAVM